MKQDLNKNYRDISDENKSREDDKLTPFDIIIRLPLLRLLP